MKSMNQFCLIYKMCRIYKYNYKCLIYKLLICIIIGYGFGSDYNSCSANNLIVIRTHRSLNKAID